MPKFNLREGETVDLKESWADSALNDLAAFANHKGGTVYVGVRDKDLEVVGFTGGDSEVRRIANTIVSILRITPSLESQEYKGKTILAIHVFPAPNLITYKDRCPIPVGSSTRYLSPEEIAKRTMVRLGVTWDGLTTSGLGMSDVEPEAVKQFLRHRERFSTEPKLDDPVESVVGNLDLIKDGKLTNAGVLLFTKIPHRTFPYARIKMGRFKGETILDSREVVGNLWSQLEEVMERFRNYLQIELEIDSKTTEGRNGQRNEIWEYPLDALIEAVANALIHRDYTAVGDIQIKVYDDHIEIWNPGWLPDELTVDALKRQHRSVPRNRLVADAFYKARMIEAWGSGTLKMIKLCEAQGLTEPEFSEESGGFKLVFSKDPYTLERMKKLGLSERQIKAVLYAKENQRITNQEYQKLFGVSKPTASRDLDELLKKGVLIKEGTTGRGTHYRLSKGSQWAQKAHKGLMNGSRG